MTVSSQDNGALNRNGGSSLSLYAGVFVIIIIAMMVMFSYTNIEYQRHTGLYENIREQQAIAVLIGNDIADISNNRITEGITALRSHEERIERLSDTIQKDMAGGLSRRAELAKALQDIENIWKDYRVNLAAVLAGEESLKSLMTLLDRIQASIPEISSLSEQITGELVERKAGAREVFRASRQLVLIQRIENAIAEVGRTGMIADEQRLKIYADIGRDSAIYEQTLQDMLDAQQASSADDAIQDKILGISSRYRDVSSAVAGILTLEPELAKLNFAIREINRISPSFIRASESLTNAYNETGWQRNMSPAVWSMLGAGLLILTGLMIVQARAARRKKSDMLYEVNPGELINFVHDAVGDIAKDSFKEKDKKPDQTSSAYIEDLHEALEPVRKRNEFVRHTAAMILSISNGMHKSILNVVDVGDRLAQQANKAGGTVENMIGSMKRAVNEAVSLRETLNSLVNNAGASDIIRSAEIDTFGKRITQLKQAMIDLRKSAPEINGVAGRIKSEAAKINMIALNTAILTDGSDGEEEELFAADEIQQHAHRIAGITGHLADLGTEFDSVIGHALAEIESMANDPGIDSPAGKDQQKIYQQARDNNAILIEKMWNVNKVIEYQLNAAGEASSCLTMLQEEIVGLSADINDIMAGVESLERLSKDLKGSW